MPDSTRRSSTRGIPRVSVGKSGAIRAHCTSENQKKSATSNASPSGVLNHPPINLGILFMGPDPSSNCLFRTSHRSTEGMIFANRQGARPVVGRSPLDTVPLHRAGYRIGKLARKRLDSDASAPGHPTGTGRTYLRPSRCVTMPPTRHTIETPDIAPAKRGTRCRAKGDKAAYRAVEACIAPPAGRTATLRVPVEPAEDLVPAIAPVSRLDGKVISRPVPRPSAAR